MIQNVGLIYSDVTAGSDVSASDYHLNVRKFLGKSFVFAVLLSSCGGSDNRIAELESQVKELETQVAELDVASSETSEPKSPQPVSSTVATAST